MRGSVIDTEGAGSSANIDTQRFPGEGLLKDPLAEVPGKKESVRTIRAEGSEKPQVRNADVLRLVHDREVERRMLAPGHDRSQAAEQASVRDQVPGCQTSADAIEDGPEDGALRLGESCLSAQAHDIAIRLPAFQLPRINGLFPFRVQKMEAELVIANLLGCLSQQIANDFACREIRLAEMRLVEAAADGVDRVNIDAFG